MWLPEDGIFFKKDAKFPATNEELLKFLDRLQSQRNPLLRNLFVTKPPQMDILHR